MPAHVWANKSRASKAVCLGAAFGEMPDAQPSSLAKITTTQGGGGGGHHAKGGIWRFRISGQLRMCRERLYFRQGLGQFFFVLWRGGCDRGSLFVISRLYSAEATSLKVGIVHNIQHPSKTQVSVAPIIRMKHKTIRRGLQPYIP